MLVLVCLIVNVFVFVLIVEDIFIVNFFVFEIIDVFSIFGVNVGFVVIFIVFFNIILGKEKSGGKENCYYDYKFFYVVVFFSGVLLFLLDNFSFNKEFCVMVIFIGRV